MVDADPAEVRRLLAHHGLPIVESVPTPFQGDANRTYLAGDYVVRLARPTVLEDWRTERLAHPYVRAQGVRTPEFVASGDHYTIVARAEGRRMHEDASAAFFRDLGRQLARLHALAPPDDPEGVLDDHDPMPIELGGLPELLRPLAERLDGLTDANGRTFIHGDLTVGNVLVGPHDEAILIDWGDAGRGGAAYDFIFIPLRGLGFALNAYGATHDLRRRTVALFLSAAAYDAKEGDQKFLESAIANRELLEELIGD